MFEDFEDDDGEPFDREALLEVLREAARNPMPYDRLQSLMREMKIRLHKEYSLQAARELHEFGAIDSLTQIQLEFGRTTMRDWGIEAVAMQIERDAGLLDNHFQMP